MHLESSKATYFRLSLISRGQRSTLTLYMKTAQTNQWPNQHGYVGMIGVIDMVVVFPNCWFSVFMFSVRGLKLSAPGYGPLISNNNRLLVIRNIYAVEVTLFEVLHNCFSERNTIVLIRNIIWIDRCVF